jgi:two-component system chemotaxis response regulator CheB
MEDLEIFKDRTLMVVDDSIFIRRQLVQFFEGELGMKVIREAENGKLAVDALDECDPDIITLDLTMPEMDGPTALGLILEKKPSAKVIVVTASIGPKVLQCMEMGAITYIDKPLQLQEKFWKEGLMETIRDVLSK